MPPIIAGLLLAGVGGIVALVVVLAGPLRGGEEDASERFRESFEEGFREGIEDVGEQLADSDNDGVANYLDNCQGAPETLNGYQDFDGCPDTSPLGEPGGAPGP